MTRPGEYAHDGILWLLGTLLLGAALYVSYTGVVGSVPQDEGAYVFAAQRVHDVGISAFVRGFCDIDSRAPVNPAVLMQTRVLANWLLARPLALAEPSLQSFGSVGVAFLVAAYLLSFRLVSIVSGARVAIICCTLAFLNPSLLVSAGRALPDALMAACLMIACAALSPVDLTDGIALSRVGIAAVAFGMAVLLKEGALVMGVPLFGALILFAGRRRNRAVLIFAAIAGLVVALGYSAVWSVSGCGVWIPSIVRAAHEFKFFEEARTASLRSFAIVDVIVLPGYRWFYHLQNVTFTRGLSLEALHYVPVLPVLVLTAVTIARTGVAASTLRIVVPVLLLWAALEFGPADIVVRGGRLTYCPIFKEVDSFKFALFFAPLLLLPLHQWASVAHGRLATMLPAAAVIGGLSVGAAALISVELRSPAEAIKSRRFALNNWLDGGPGRIIVCDTYSSFVLDLSLQRRERSRIVNFGNFLRRSEPLRSGVEVLYFENRWMPMDIAPDYEEHDRAEFLRTVGPEPRYRGPDFAIYSGQ